MTQKEQEQIVDQLDSIRFQIWNTSDDMALTRIEREAVDIVRQRIWNLKEKIKAMETNG